MSKNQENSKSEDKIDWSLVFDEVIFSTSVFVDCLSQSLITTNTTPSNSTYVRRHITPPHMNEVGRKIMFTNKKYNNIMSAFRDALKDTETQRHHVACELMKLYRSTLFDFSTQQRPVILNPGEISPLKSMDLKLFHRDKLCFRIYMMQCFSGYLVELYKTTAVSLHDAQKMGNYTTGCQSANQLNVADMVQWVVENLSPHVLALMTPTAAVLFTHSDGD
jgi:hypothetical protein